MKSHLQRELVIVGGGILGLMTAHVAYKRGFRDITIYEAPGSLNLNADSLRNHAWLQSGLLYGKSNRVTAKILSQWGGEMLKAFGYPPPQTKGIFRLPDDDEESEREFNDRVEYLLIASKVRRLTENEARQALGAFFKSGFIHYWVPDTPFDEAFLLHKARQRAKALNINLRRAKVSVIKRGEPSAGSVIEVDGQHVVESKNTILCAGSGLPALLDALGVEHPLAVFRSALLRIARGNVLRTPLLVDISEGQSTSGLSVVQHSAAVVPPKGCLVIGSKDRVRLTPEEVKTRVVTRQEDERLKDLIPRSLLPAKRGVELRVEAGYKTEACDENGNPSVAHWIKTWDTHPGLVAAVPGKATQALYVAEKIMDCLKSPAEVPAVPPPTSSPPGEESDYVPKMHHDPIFDGVLDEVEK